MAYIGKVPTAVPLTSSDITNGIVTTAKIADDAVDNTKLDLTDDFAFTGTISGAGGLIKLQTTTIDSAVASVTIGSSSLFSSTYDFYIIRGRMRPATSGSHGYVRVRTSAGVKSGSDYQYSRMWQYAGSATVNTDNSTTDTKFTNVLGQSLHSTHGCVFEIFISQPNNTSVYKPISFRTIGLDTTPNSAHHTSAGVWDGGTDALTGLDLYFSSGNIDTGGLINLYGVVK